jgi:hypothetical protein
VPNGRSGGFVIKRKEVKRLLYELDGSTVIGSAQGTPLTANATREFLKKTWTFGGPLSLKSKTINTIFCILKNGLQLPHRVLSMLRFVNTMFVGLKIRHINVNSDG